MSSYGMPYRKVVVGAADSVATGRSCYVGDLRQITVSIQTSTTSASRFTIIGTNDDGFTRALGAKSPVGASQGWSIVTAITGGAGNYTIDPGLRWLSAIRPDFTISAASSATVTFAGRT